MNESDATAANEHLNQMIFHANHALFIANNSGDEDMKARTQKVLGAVVTALDFELLEPIYKAFPNLRSAGL